MHSGSTLFRNRNWRRHVGLDIALVLVGAMALGCLILFAGEQPFAVIQILLQSSVGSVENLSQTLIHAIPLLFTGTAVAVAFQAGLYNIGAEGQLYSGALLGLTFGLAYQRLLEFFAVDTSSKYFLFFSAIGIGGIAASAFLGGALMGAVVGVWRAYGHVHEVIGSILLNFIILAFANWAIVGPLRNPLTQNTETRWLMEGLRLRPLFGQVPWSLICGCAVALILPYLLRHSWTGLAVRTLGKSERVARFMEVNVERLQVFTMAISGGIAGLVGFHVVCGVSYRVADGFSPGWGFMGLAVALLSQGRGYKLILFSLFFGALHQGAWTLDLETEHLSRDFAAVVQGVILMVAAALARRPGQVRC